ncbi:sulfite reductase (NADPH) flavoprotein alpha-component [Duganella sacchari]|uniref:Sulfite reductase (NADPH) flavoprotein alpha-component n=1 Tax=Duganella sacchari TaxID=551987 RepID=A0A1M7M7B6_9BURK|nr:sulfite reductase flavoprotein subunit alpha [Duganella sacchari]SHM86153.1 sulfite reductase (NADPH) flavoprotein alpha-component [Duganella sacchari]
MKKLWFQLHWFVGITAGTVLMVIGLSGAVLAFREQILDALNPGVRNVAVQNTPVLTPQEFMTAARALKPHERVTSIILYDTPGSSARIGLAPAPGVRKGETIYLNPYNAALLPELAGEDFFEWVEQLHRFLLLPRDPGKVVSGTLAFCLMGLALSGLYLRWPRRVWDWRTWLTFDVRMKGRSFLWGLHSVAGTWVMVVFLVFTASGVYWAFDPIRDMADGWMGTLRPPREAAAAKPKAPQPPKAEAADLNPSWETFQKNAPNWHMAFLRPPERASQPMQILWVAKDAPHVRARSSMSINLQTGALLKSELYADKPAGARFQSVIYPLHLGTYFGISGQIIVFIAALALPGFGITGWMLYLNRRKQKRIARAERAQFAASASAATQDAPILMAYASQTGQAERLALQSAAALQKAGVAVHVQSLEQLTPPQLGQYRRALFVASSFGEGEPPDSARRFSRLLQGAKEELKHMQYAVLALGDRNYAEFCGFGRTLDQRLALLGAQPLHPMIEVDNGDAGALARWGSALREMMGGTADVTLSAAADDSDYATWHLAGHKLLNPGSVGFPLYEITLTGDVGAGWRPGALVDIWPGHYGKDATPRRYSLASIPQDGSMQLVVRQVGLASGWLTAQAATGDAVRVRLIANPSFDAAAQTAPAIYIGNGSGIAGLRSHLRARVLEGATRNWLIFGERQREHDAICAEEIHGWRSSGFLPELDLVYSRDAEGGGYVQNRLRERADAVHAWLNDGAVIFVCGSLQGMAGGVDEALAAIIGREQLAQLAEQGRYRRDVY